ncbi:MAG: hypothetical protein ACE366_30945 [Bradymonadia bacterium]
MAQGGEDSPLRMLSRRPHLNRLLQTLSEARGRIMRAPGQTHEITVSRGQLLKARHSWSQLLREGEKSLHRLCALLSDHLFVQPALREGPDQSVPRTAIPNTLIRSKVIGALPRSGERFTLTQRVTPRLLLSASDLDLGYRLLSRLRHRDHGVWSTPELVASMVEYQPTVPNPHNVQKMISRVKAEEELWNKVCDELFDLDSLVRKDKKLRPLSRYIKDVFGIKLVVANPDEVMPLQRVIEGLTFTDEALRRRRVHPGPDVGRLEFTEVKDYHTDPKGSGWRAVKSVVRWRGRTFEIQVQGLANYLLEQEWLTQESHASFKQRRERIRDEVARQIPLFGFYRDLLMWLVLGPEGTHQAEVPTHPGVHVVITD